MFDFDGCFMALMTLSCFFLIIFLIVVTVCVAVDSIDEHKLNEYKLQQEITEENTVFYGCDCAN